MPSRPEKLIIRPPSEWRSLLLRSTRGCKWNRCKFCGIYPALGEPAFSVRPVDDVLRDIDWYAARGFDYETAFIGDADPLCRPVEESTAIIRYLLEKHPSLGRVTAYARAGTLYKHGSDAIGALAHAGLTRVHIGLESGDKPTLKFHRKGQSPAMVIQAVQMAHDVSIEVSVYVLLGLGGEERWKEHIDATAGVINRINPEFVRIRRIWLYDDRDSPRSMANPLLAEIRSGTFLPRSPEGTVLELRRLIAGIESVQTHLVCDHANNYVRVEGGLPGEKDRMLAEIDAFLELPCDEREKRYREVGSRI